MELQTIPGVGPSLATDLRELGFRRVEDLRQADTAEPEPPLLRWWNWKDGGLAGALRP